mmetsp:Transcript_66999/g.118971  ORF Transcript_66999/g.118971 Transcript_66999/m.118971 type:complete len:156 (-) Transcript_66999:163-630(-)
MEQQGRCEPALLCYPAPSPDGATKCMLLVEPYEPCSVALGHGRQCKCDQPHQPVAEQQTQQLGNLRGAPGLGPGLSPLPWQRFPAYPALSIEAKQWLNTLNRQHHHPPKPCPSPSQGAGAENTGQWKGHNGYLKSCVIWTFACKGLRVADLSRII